MPEPTVGVAVITYNSAKHLPSCLSPLLASRMRPRILVVDAGSTDDTVNIAKRLGAETMSIPTREYNHGLTRERARKHLNTDIAVMMTPDAYAIYTTMLETLVAPIVNGDAAVAYARQLPHRGASAFEAFPREYNYPSESHIRGIEDAKKYKAYTFFCSNSCAAYDQQALDAVGGFPSVLLGEDTCAVAKLLRAGYRIAYVAEARVRHSHRYSLKQEFQRYFDTGLARHEYRDLIDIGSSDERRGADFVRAFVRRILQERPLLLPYAALHTAAKWIGYRLGAAATRAPTRIKEMLSSQKFYWSSDEFRKRQNAKHNNKAVQS
ncbi:O antigen biosynthesis rhamnosyltransferase RfbN [Chlamydiales bacterium SCGC AG-110-P3]|nr:O antigen biosynthesis rhamnosyltransferase RfbN [Chlamydiales bacterium SCGC AG-110-P3]